MHLDHLLAHFSCLRFGFVDLLCEEIVLSLYFCNNFCLLVTDLAKLIVLCLGELMFPMFGGQLSLQLSDSDALLRIDLPLIVYFFLFLSPSLIPCIAIKQFLAFLRSIQEVFHLQCNSLSGSIDSCGTFDRGCSGRG